MNSKLFKTRISYLGLGSESGKAGYLVLWLMGFPAGLLILLWLVLGNNIFGAG